MLGTAQLRIVNSQQPNLTLRGLCHTGAQVSLITEHSVQALELKREPSNLIITGVGSASAGNTLGMVCVCESHQQTTINFVHTTLSSMC